MITLEMLKIIVLTCTINDSSYNIKGVSKKRAACRKELIMCVDKSREMTNTDKLKECLK